MKKKHIGSSFDRWLREEGLEEQVTAAAIKRVLARQTAAAPREGQPGGAGTRSEKTREAR